MTHQGPKAALGDGGSAHGCGKRRCLPGPAQQEALCGPCFPRAAPAAQRGTCFAPACVAACREAWGRAEVAWDGDRSMARRKDGAGGTKAEHRYRECKLHMQEAHPFSQNSTVSTLPLFLCTRCVVRAIVGNAAMLPAAPVELRWAQRSARCPTTQLGHAVLHSPLSCNTCSPPGCFVSLDQK